MVGLRNRSIRGEIQMRLRTAIGSAVAVLVAIACQSLRAQSTPAPASPTVAEQEPTLRLEVRRVPIDIVVLDKQGNPVKGLTAADFEIKEEGVVQTIRSFDTTDGSKPSYTPPKLPALPANTYVNVPETPERGPLYILYYDMADTAQEDQMAFHKELLKFVDNAQPGVRIAIFIRTQKIYILQGFTTDHDLLREAIERKGPGPHIPDVFLYGNTNGAYDASAALSSLDFIAEYMSGIPGRKNLLWLSDDFPIPVAPALVGTNQVMQGGAPGNPSAGGGGPMVLDFSDLLADMMKRTYSQMMKSQIALYPVDLTPNGTHSPDVFDREDMVAASTGGRAFYANNHTHELIDQAVDHGETYYTLTYAPTTEFDGSVRRIAVKLTGAHPDWKLTYREVYYAVADDDIEKQHRKDVVQKRFLEAKAEDTLYANIEHGAPMLHDLLFSLHLSTVGKQHLASDAEMAALQDSPAYFRTRKANTVKPLKPPPVVRLQRYRIDYGVIDPQLRKIASVPGSQPTIEFAAAAYNSEGTLLNSVLNQGAPSGTGGDGKTGALFRAEQEIEVPEGAAYIRVAVRDMTTNRTGTLETELPLKPESGKQTAQKTN
jgi:VWFA-related protein